MAWARGASLTCCRNRSSCHVKRPSAVAGSPDIRALKPPPDRLYGRGRGHRLRPRQLRLLEVTLPRLAFAPEQAADPLSAFTPRSSELWLEVGFGGGEHALAQIAAHPEAGLIACEVFDNGICSLLSRLVPDGCEATAPLPGNLRLWTGDARTLLRLLPDRSLDRLFLLFPDPWPKARHAKRRFVHPALLPLLARVLKPGAMWHVASDDPTYQAWVAEVMAEQSGFDAPPPARERPPGWPATRYEAKALREGRLPCYWTFTRRAA
jgi:tRNA (guanine-N7-)-methyltransferase